MALPSILLDACTFFTLVFGLGLFWLPWFRGEGLERLTLTAAAGLAQLYAFSWSVYLLHAPTAAWHLLPVLALLAITWRWAALRELATSADVRSTALRLGLFAAWVVGWLCLVRSYGGGEWSGDWSEHYERELFFLQHQPLETKFTTGYGITSRPPLANLVVGALLALRGTGFPHAQVFMTLFSSLVLLPALLLTRQFSRGAARDGVLAVLLMLSPFVLQNATFAWTKLPCTFFVLAALACYIEGMRSERPAQRTMAFGLMALGALTHYSAAPYLLALGAVHTVARWSRGGAAAVKELCGQAVVAAGLFGTWLGWAWWQYGGRATWLDNSTITAEAGLTASTQFLHRLHTAWATLVPHPLRPADYGPIQQLSSLGYARDYLFNIYQTTWLGALGCSGLVLAAAVFARGRHRGPGQVSPFWIWLTGIVTVLGIATYAGADRWGIAHITFGPLAIAALAWLAARAPLENGAVRRFWLGALGLDALLGIALHFYLQWSAVVQPSDVHAFLAGRPGTFSPTVTRNALCKEVTNVAFVADAGPPASLLLPFLALLALLALLRCRRPGFSRAADPADAAGRFRGTSRARIEK